MFMSTFIRLQNAWKGVAWEVSGTLTVNLEVVFTCLEILPIRCFTSRKQVTCLEKYTVILQSTAVVKVLKLDHAFSCQKV